MRIQFASVFVEDQDQALRFYTEKLGFVKKSELPAGKFKWLTVVSPEGSSEIELLLEPNANEAAKTFQRAIFEQGIPATSFGCTDVRQECERLKAKGVRFTMEPAETQWGVIATFDDTCGNLINLHTVPPG